MQNKEYLNSIRLFGLTDYEARSFLVLLTTTVLNARELSTAAGVPYTKIYSTVRNLQTQGFIEIVPGRPQRYRAVPPDVALRNRLNDIEKQHHSKMATLKKVAKEISSSYERGESRRMEREVYMLTGMRNVNAKLQELLDETRDEAFMVVARMSHAMGVLPAFHDAKARGVLIRIMTHDNRNKDEEIRSFREVAKVRFHPGASSLMAIFDREVVLQSVGNPIGGPEDHLEHRGVLIRDAAHANMIYGIYSPCWEELPES